MRRVIEFTIFFFILIFLQAFLFSKIDLWGYVNPYVYIMIILMLPMGMNRALSLFLGFMLGLMFDFISGNMGLHTICTTWLAYIRPFVLRYTAGEENMDKDVLPTARRIGKVKFISYVSIMCLMFSVPFFLLESMGVGMWWQIVLRILLSSIATVISVYLIQMVYFKE